MWLKEEFQCHHANRYANTVLIRNNTVVMRCKAAILKKNKKQKQKMQTN